jgi:hypothetical protein
MHLHRVLGEQIHDDLEAGGIAQLEQRRARGDHPLAALLDAQDAAVDR